MEESNEVEETICETRFRKDSSRIDTKLFYIDKKKADSPTGEPAKSPVTTAPWEATQTVHQRIKRHLTLSVIRKIHTQSTRAVSLAAAENGSAAYFKENY